MTRNNQSAFSLVELLISMTIGIFLLGGVITIFINSQQSYHAAATLNQLTSDARFATHFIRQDIQLSGAFGKLDQKHITTVVNAQPNIAGDCAVQWFGEMNINIRAYDDNNPFAATCATKSSLANTDVLVLRYANPVIVPSASITDNALLYIRTTTDEGELFTKGAGVPTLASESATQIAQNNQIQAIAYYISDYTDTVGDGYPSLHRVRLVSGPALEDEVIIPGVADMQIQLGYDSDGNGSVNQYVNPENAVLDWTDVTLPKKILSVSISLLLVGEEVEAGLDTSNTFDYADKQVVVANDGKFRKLVNTVIPLKNKLR